MLDAGVSSRTEVSREALAPGVKIRHASLSLSLFVNIVGRRRLDRGLPQRLQGTIGLAESKPN